jgi:hypothetical protein
MPALRDLFALDGNDACEMLATGIECDEPIMRDLASNLRGLGGVRNDGLRLCGCCFCARRDRNGSGSSTIWR